MAAQSRDCVEDMQQTRNTNEKFEGVVEDSVKEEKERRSQNENSEKELVKVENFMSVLGNEDVGIGSAFSERRNSVDEQEKTDSDRTSIDDQEKTASQSCLLFVSNMGSQTESSSPVTTSKTPDPFCNSTLSKKQEHVCLPQPRKKQKRSAPPKKEGQVAGRWTAEEHRLFLEGLKIYGREWKKVAEKIKTRSSAQIRSHAQKYFSKLDKDNDHRETFQLHDPSVPIEHHSFHSDSDRVENASSPYSSVKSESMKTVQIERIMNDPSGVENDVICKLKALRERYFQLQLQLQDLDCRKQCERKSPNDRPQNTTVPPADFHVLQRSCDPTPNDMKSGCRPLHFVSPNKNIVNASELGKSRDSEVVHNSETTCESNKKLLINPDVSTDLNNKELIALQVLGKDLISSKPKLDSQRNIVGTEN